ncbi:hypothetical protein C3E78_08555 [Aeromicrobium chenweiae]|uniref:Uncharacterized protein n=1 Tax=Aeromicrobium chenweiae TaxID=2079793 RepID=A0A2S0WLQ8_9ACTN|nr:hypothetical protein C3E78_08555 [Aeromicrobium chenweiae]
MGEEYVRQIVDLSPGQRTRYLSQIRVLDGLEIRGTRIFGRPVDAIVEGGGSNEKVPTICQRPSSDATASSEQDVEFSWRH